MCWTGRGVGRLEHSRSHQHGRVTKRSTTPSTKYCNCTMRLEGILLSKFITLFMHTVSLTTRRCTARNTTYHPSFVRSAVLRVTCTRYATTTENTRELIHYHHNDFLGVNNCRKIPARRHLISLEALAVHNGWTRFIILFLRDPHTLEG